MMNSGTPKHQTAICKIDSKLKVKHKTNLLFFGNFMCPIHPTSSDYSRKCH